jgi:hypothetical protein
MAPVSLRTVSVTTRPSGSRSAAMAMASSNVPPASARVNVSEQGGATRSLAAALASGLCSAVHVCSQTVVKCALFKCLEPNG